jgi:hypothetical protein
VEDDAVEAERVGAGELVDERGHRLLAQRRIGRRDVDQVAGVRHDRMQAVFGDQRPEAIDFGRFEWPSAPLVRVPGEYLEGFAAVQGRALDRARHAAGGRHVGTDPRHPDSMPRRGRGRQVTRRWRGPAHPVYPL